MSTVYILVGPPGVGKSKYAIENMGEEDVRVCLDDIKLMMGAYSRKKLQGVQEYVEKAAIIKALNVFRDVWVDRTCMAKSSRARIIKMVKPLMPRIVVIDFMKLNIPADVLVERRMQAPRDISRRKWNMIIKGMVKKFQEPELSEGIDEIRAPN
jgi:predicted kinase